MAKNQKRLTASAVEVLADAREFTMAAHFIRSKGLMGPSHAIAVFGGELLLKGVAQIRKGSFLKTHDLVELFTDLPDDDQRAVYHAHRVWLDVLKYPEADPDGLYLRVLRDIRRDFERLRYAFAMPDLEDRPRVDANDVVKFLWIGTQGAWETVDVKFRNYQELGFNPDWFK